MLHYKMTPAPFFLFSIKVLMRSSEAKQELCELGKNRLKFDRLALQIPNKCSFSLFSTILQRWRKVHTKYILHATGGKISYLTTIYRVTLNIRFFLESVKREEKGGRWEEEEENIAKQSYHVLKP